jgi:MSHA biogenesis protein MshJ
VTWVQLNEKFSELSFRERALVFGGIFSAVLFVLLQFLVFPVLEKQSALEKQLAQQKSAFVQLTHQYKALQLTIENDPNDALRDEQKALRKNLLDIEMILQDKVSALLSPRQTQDLLRSLLADYKGLTLIEARNLEPKEVVIETKDSLSAADDIHVSVFEHGFEMTLTGSYFETMKYISRLEELNGFYWSNVRYEVLEYPSAEIVIGISTFSINEAWIGG